MMFQTNLNQRSVWPRVWGVEDPSLVDLSDAYTAIELFVDEPENGPFHVFRYIIETENNGLRVTSEGILVGKSQSDERPKLIHWNGECANLKILSCIDLGVEIRSLNGSNASISGKINDDPIVFLNFDPKTTTARFMSSLDYVPEPVRERHRGFLPKPAKVVSPSLADRGQQVPASA